MACLPALFENLRVDILLKKWDGKRGIERNQIYRQLSPKRKKDLLSLIASETFNRGNIFFRQKIAESLIEGFIQNLPEAAKRMFEMV